MPDVQSSHLRIYCICGQKMKISEKMYGLPGKCIACRQKIRIPTQDEVPSGANEIYLKDHPELLRGPKRSKEDIAKQREAQKALDSVRPADLDDSTPITELDLVGGLTPAEKAEADARGGVTLPLDTLDSLQKLCSIEYKIKRQLATLDDFEHDDDTLRAEVDGHLARVRKHRGALDDHLHQLLMEVAIELTNTQEKIGQTRLDARVGKLPFAKYQDIAYRLRARRDRLERRQQNLRGWLATTTPYGAGGLLDLSVDSLPQEGFSGSLPAEQNEADSLLQAHVAGLRAALSRRTHADRSLDEAERIAAEDEGESMNTARIDAQWERRLARAAVAFYLGRLERLKKDYASDLDTINAQMEAARGNLKVDEIDRRSYDEIERGLLRAKSDVARARTVVARALTANASSDVPHPSGTFLERIGISGSGAPSPNTWLGWSSALALCAGIFLPVLDGTSLVGAFLEFQAASGIAAWSFVVPILIALAVASAVQLPNASSRGLLLLLIWCIALATAGYGWFQGMNSLHPMAEMFRAGGSWLIRPGVWILGAGLAGIACAAVAALWSAQSLRLLVLSVLLLGIVALGLLPSDFGGLIAPRPVIDVVLTEGDEDSETPGSILITNLGRRALNLVSRPTDARSSYLLVMEKRVGANSWSEVNLPVSSEASGIWQTVGPNESYTVPFRVGPGEYRVLLLSSARGTELSKSFPVEDRVASEIAPQPPNDPIPEPEFNPFATAESTPVTAVVETIIEEEEPAPPALPAPGTLVQAELKGVMTGSEGATRFSFARYFPDDTRDRVTLLLGDFLWEEWEVAEYNPAFRTVTLQRAGHLLILRYGQAIDLPE